MIVDKINMVKLEMLSNIGKQLAKDCGLSNPNMAVLEACSLL